MNHSKPQRSKKVAKGFIISAMVLIAGYEFLVMTTQQRSFTPAFFVATGMTALYCDEELKPITKVLLLACLSFAVWNFVVLFGGGR